MQMQAQQAEAQGQHLALAFMANNPTIQESLQKLGMTKEQWNQLPLDAQAGLVGQVINYEGVRLEYEGKELNNKAIAWEISAKEAYGSQPIDSGQAFTFVQGSLADIQQTLNVNKLKKNDAVTAVYKLQEVKQFISYISDKKTKDFYMQQVKSFESKIDSKYPGLTGQPATTPMDAQQVASGPKTGWGHVGETVGIAGQGLNKALNWAAFPVTASGSAFQGALEGMSKPSGSFGESMKYSSEATWKDLKKKLGLK